MNTILPYLVVGLSSGSVYALVGLGIVLTYKTSGILNLGQGALATASAYIFYTLHFEHGVAWPVAGAVAVVVGGLVFGVALERMARGLEGADLSARIVATVGVLLLIQATCELIFGNYPLVVTPFLPVGHLTLFGAVVTYDKIIVVVIALAATVMLYAFFRRTRLGKSMRAVVDNPSLLNLSGTNPVQVRRAAWIIGCIFATLSGPLLVEILGMLDPSTLTSVVIQAFAAAALGSFASLPLTYAGGLLIGVATSVTQMVVGSQSSLLSSLPAAMPFVILFVLMLVMPRTRLALRSMVPRRSPPAWSFPFRFQAVGMIVAVAFLAAVPAWAGYHVGDWTAMLTYLILFLSLGLLVRTSGQVSLCHATFAAIGAVAFSKLVLELGIPWLPALILAGLVAVPIGAMLAIPAIRLSGVFLALATFGFGFLVQDMFYNSNVMFGSSLQGATDPLPHLSWLPLDTTTGFYYVVLAAAVICSAVVVMLIRSRLGRLLRGMADSSLALSTSGTSVNVTRVLVFCISAYLAAIAGALYGVYIVAPTGLAFDPFSSLTFVALIVIAVGGAPWYALVSAAGFQLVSAYWHPTGITYYMQIVFGASAIALALFPPKGLLPASVRDAIDRLSRRTEPDARRTRLRSADLPHPAERRVAGHGDLTVRDLTVSYGGLKAVTKLDLVAPTGRITGLIGPNGAGKTTTFNACTGLVRPAIGQVVLNGIDVSRMGPAARARHALGRTYQQVELWNSLTVSENVALGAEAGLAGASVLRQLVAGRTDRSRIAAAASVALRLCGLEGDADRPVASLSTGRRRLVEVARCLAGDFNIVLMDEPSSGLDKYETEAFGRMLRRVMDERTIGILLVEHDMRLVMDVCEYIYVLDFGQEIFRGTPAQVAASEVVRMAYLGSQTLEPTLGSDALESTLGSEVLE